MLRANARKSVVAAAAVIVGAIAFLNSLPDFVDRTVPWFGQHLNVVGVVLTVWQAMWIGLGIVSLVVMVAVLVLVTRDRSAPASRKAGATPEAFDPAETVGPAAAATERRQSRPSRSPEPSVGTYEKPGELTAPPRVDEADRGRGSAPVSPPETAEAPSSPDEPPVDWGAQHWRGKQILRCPFCSYRTISTGEFSDHSDVHTDPPTPGHAQQVYQVPMAWAKVPVHFIGDGSAYLSGVPADPDHTLYTSAARAAELVESGLYDPGLLAKQEHGLAAVGRTLVCKCGFEAGTTPEFQSHLQS